MGVNINTVVVAGMLARDPEERTFNNGGRVVSFSIGFLESSWFDKQEKKWKYKNGFLDVKKNFSGEYAANGAEALLKYAKGMHVIIEGKLGFEEWEDKNGGSKRTKVVLVASKVTGLSADKSDRGDSRGDDDNGNRRRSNGNGGSRRSQRDDAPDPDDGGGELPF